MFTTSSAKRLTVNRCAVASLFALLSMVIATTASACPFCGTVTQTLGEEMGGSAAVVLARIVIDEDAAEPEATDDGTSIPAVQPKTRFRVEGVLKGEELLAGTDEIEVLFFGQPKPDATYLVMAIDGPSLEWSTPIVLTDEAVEYVSQLLDLPEKGGDRLEFFQEYFEHADPMLAQDAYDEFAKAPYLEVKELKDRMYHDKYVGWIENTDVTSSRRRLYLTLLGICGSEADVPMLAEMIKSDNRETKTALDALIACYLTLGGNDGMPLVEELFLANADAEYTDTYAAIMALRFHGQEEDKIDRERLLAAMRLMLDRPTLADLVIPDLARWEDWSVADRLVTLYKEADTESSWVRVPVIHYLRAMQNKIDAHLKELAEIDPDAYKRANTFFPIQAAGKPVPPATDAADTSDAGAAGSDTADVTTASDDAPDTDTAEADSTEAGADKAPTTSQTDRPTAETETNQLAAATAVPEAASVTPVPTGEADVPAPDSASPDSAESEGTAPNTVSAATGGEGHADGHAMPDAFQSRLPLLVPVAGVMLFAVFALLLLGGRQPNQTS